MDPICAGLLEAAVEEDREMRSVETLFVPLVLDLLMFIDALGLLEPMLMKMGLIVVAKHESLAKMGLGMDPYVANVHQIVTPAFRMRLRRMDSFVHPAS